eukprot:3878305-Rhodomonas_salina.1
MFHLLLSCRALLSVDVSAVCLSRCLRLESSAAVLTLCCGWCVAAGVLAGRADGEPVPGADDDLGHFQRRDRAGQGRH